MSIYLFVNPNSLNLRQQLHAYRANQGSRPVLEEFYPSKTQARRTQTSLKQTDIGFNVNPKLGLDTKRINGGAFLPFSKDRNSSCPGSTLQALSDLPLASVNKDIEDKKCSETENGLSCLGKVGNVGAVIEQGKGTSSNTADGQTTINLIGRLGAAGHLSGIGDLSMLSRCLVVLRVSTFFSCFDLIIVATPKRIRELMKVEGLTKDDLKSHLQASYKETKPKSTSNRSPTPQLVALGGIWVPPEYATAAAAAHGGAPTLYGAHHPAAPHGAPHFCASPMPQKFYTAGAAATPVPAPPQLHHITLHQFHMYKATLQAHSSPESDVRLLPSCLCLYQKSLYCVDCGCFTA
ncbi:hypothetical protein REPUB_Repub16aG0078000 [Reevesia pubescens]